MGDANEEGDLAAAPVQVILGLAGVPGQAVNVHVLGLAVAHVDEALVVGRVVGRLEVVQLALGLRQHKVALLPLPGLRQALASALLPDALFQRPRQHVTCPQPDHSSAERFCQSSPCALFAVGILSSSSANSYITGSHPQRIL